jgi:hypothetical protein
MGIVDFLQEWNVRKRVERAAKIYIQRNDPQGVSVMRPLPYRDRFQKKMEQIFDLDDPFGLFDDRGSASVRKELYLATEDGRPILMNQVYREIPRDNNRDCGEGEGTVVNALHMLHSTPLAPSATVAPALPLSLSSPHPPYLSSSSSLSPSIHQRSSPFSSVHNLSSSHSSYVHADAGEGVEGGEEDEFGLVSLSHEKLTTVDIFSDDEG